MYVSLPRNTAHPFSMTQYVESYTLKKNPKFLILGTLTPVKVLQQPKFKHSIFSSKANKSKLPEYRNYIAGGLRGSAQHTL